MQPALFTTAIVDNNDRLPFTRAGAAGVATGLTARVLSAGVIGVSGFRVDDDDDDEEEEKDIFERQK